MNFNDLRKIIENHPRSSKAIDYGNTSVSYGELITLAHQVNTLLLQRENPEAPYFILADKSPLQYAAVLTSLLMGIPFIPLNLNTPATKIKSLQEKTKANLLLGSAEALNENTRSPFELRVVTTPLLLRESPTEWSAPLSPYIYFMSSSGSTGARKLALFESQAFYSLLGNLAKIYQWPSKTRSSNTFDLTFDPSLADFTLSLTNGSCLVPLLKNDLYNLFSYVQQRNIDILSLTPSLVNLNRQRHRWSVDSQLPHLKKTLFTGEKLSAELARFWHQTAPQSEIENLYGPMECCIWVTRSQVDLDLLSQSHFQISIGKPLPGVDIEIDPCDESDPSIGELIVSGPQVFSGYFEKAETNPPRGLFSSKSSRHYRTGDLVQQRQGQLYYLGRLDDQIKVGGQRFSPEEIEQQIAAETSLSIYLIGKYLEGSTETIASVVSVSLAELTEDEKSQLHRWFQKNLSSSFIPKQHLTVNSPPLNESGKLDRRKLFERVNNLKKPKGDRVA